MTTTGSDGWRALGKEPAEALVPARLALHWAAQVPASFGIALARPAADFDHHALAFEPALRALVSRPSARGAPMRLGLRLSDLRLFALDAAGRVASALALDGRTLAEAEAWARDAAAPALAAAGVDALARPDHDLPAHPVAEGAAFERPDPAALRELGAWYANAAAELERVRARETRASLVRAWPHHFDIATLVVSDPGLAPEEARSIGIGLSPGDESYEAPYWYVNPWPAPERPEALPLASGGRWHDADWFGAVLPHGELAARPAGAQRDALRAFLATAIEAARALLDLEP